MAGTQLRAVARAVADIILPRFCIFCGAAIGHERPFDACQRCEDEFALGGEHRCAKCAALMGEYAHACPNCHGMRLAMKASTAYGSYGGDLRERLVEYKFNGRLYLGRTLGSLAGIAAGKAWPEVRFDAVTAVPLHRSRARERGFDQAEVVARYAAIAAGAPYATLLRRTRATDSQVGLTRNARVRNIKGAFQPRRAHGMKTVLVVDDIMTTGATASEAVRALKAAGVAAVYAVVVARAGLEEMSAQALTGDADGDKA